MVDLSNNLIMNNNVTNNGNGIWFSYSNNNSITNNFDNGDNIDTYNSINYFNSSHTTTMAIAMEMESETCLT